MDIAVGTNREADMVDMFSPGFGSVANSHLGLYNLDDTWTQHTLEGLNRQNDPGSGAFTAYHGRNWFITKYVGAGTEILVNYGEVSDFIFYMLMSNAIFDLDTIKFMILYFIGLVQRT